MFFFPRYQEQISSHLSSSEIIRRLKITVKYTSKQSMEHEKLGKSSSEVYLFNGLVSDTGFSISLVLEKPENYFPLINGKIISGQGQTLIQVEYELFKSVKIFYAFWTGLLFFFALYGIFQGPNYFLLISTILIQLISFWVVQNRFITGVKKSRKEILRLLK